MQYEQLASGPRVDLPRPSIDTGMGLERIAAVLQGTHDNYAIDLFATLIRAIADFTNVPSDGPHKASHKVIADHLRASSFLIADGVLPSNEGRGYVLRRIMRRAMRHAELLGAKEPLMWKLVPTLTREMGQAYPELIRAEALITETLKLEETRFRATLERGLAILDEKSRNLHKGAMFDGRNSVHAVRYLRLPARPDAGRAAQSRHQCRHCLVHRRHGSPACQGARVMVGARAMPRPKRCGSACTRRSAPPNSSATRPRARRGVVSALVRDGKEVPELKKGESGVVLLNQTPFYAESGGQVGDTGEMRREGVRLSVSDTQKKAGDLFAHSVKVEEGAVKVGDPLLLLVDHDPPRRHSSEPLRHASTARGVAPGARATTSRRRARWWRRTGCASTSRIPSRLPPRNSSASRTSPTISCCKMRL